MGLKAVEGCSLSMDTPSPQSMSDLMTHLNQCCEVGHRALSPVWGMRLHHPFSEGDRMTAKDPLKKYCPHCGEQFGHAWGGVGLKHHLWEAHGIPGEAKFNGKLIKFPREAN